MREFLLLLFKANLAMSVAISAVYFLRGPLRMQFGAGTGYLLWLMVPVSGLASLLPPRIVEQPLDTVSPVSHAIAIPEFDWPALLFSLWALGAGLMIVFLAMLQARFHRAERAGNAGPAVAGIFRLRIVMPRNFPALYTLAEQAAIITHEQAHLARQDARINALVALLRIICWFNPLVQLGSGWLRNDQELACDAAVLGGKMSSGDYARALLKSQGANIHVPFGCMWPGAEHPLVERVSLLRQCQARSRFAGGISVAFASCVAGFAAWAVQPAVAAAPRLVDLKPIAGTHVLAPYPALSLRLKEQGTVVTSVTIGKRGNIMTIKLEKSSGSQRLDQAALDTIRSHWRWHPPTLGGRAVVTTTRVNTKFVLRAAHDPQTP